MDFQVYRNILTGSISEFVQQAVSRGFSVDSVSLSSSQLPRYTQHVYLVETEVPLFDSIDSTEWPNLQRLVSQATDMVWVTNGGLLSGRDPLFAMIAGIVRGLKTEKSSLRVSTLDLDLDTEGSLFENCNTIFTILDRLSHDYVEGYTLEYRQKDHIIYRSSLQPDDEMNTDWKTRVREPTLINTLPLDHFRDMPLKLNTDQAGVPGSTFFELDRDFDREILDECVEIELGAADVSSNVSLCCSVYVSLTEISQCMVAPGRTSKSTTFSSGCAGTIRKVGKDVKGLVLGDTVYGLCSSKFGHYARVNYSLCQKVEGMSTLEVSQYDSKSSRGALANLAFLGDGYGACRFLLSSEWIDGSSPSDFRRSNVFTL